MTAHFINGNQLDDPEMKKGLQGLNPADREFTRDRDAHAALQGGFTTPEQQQEADRILGGKEFELEDIDR